MAVGAMAVGAAVVGTVVVAMRLRLGASTNSSARVQSRARRTLCTPTAVGALTRARHVAINLRPPRGPLSSPSYRLVTWSLPRSGSAPLMPPSGAPVHSSVEDSHAVRAMRSSVVATALWRRARERRARCF